MNTNPDDFPDAIARSTPNPAMGDKAFCDLSGLGLLRVCGDDAAGFLQGQATCDVLALLPGRSGYGALCTPKGRVIANFRLLRTDSGYHLLLPDELAEIVRKRLQTHVLRSRVVVEDLTPGHGVIGLLGTGFESMAAGCGVAFPAEPGRCLEQPGVLSLRLDDGTGRCLVAGGTEAIGRILTGLAGTLDRADPEAWRLRDIEAGIPEVVAATMEEFLPQMLNLDILGGIGFRKGCYTGQEIVTRTHFLGQLKRRMFRLTSAAGSVPPAGAPVFDAERPEAGTIGAVVSAARTPTGNVQLLAVLSIESRQTGNLRLLQPEGAEAALLTLPYSVEISP